MSDRDGETPIANQTTPLQQPNTQTSYGTLTFRPSFPLPSRFSYSSRCPEGHSKSYATTPLPTSPAPSYLVPRSQRPISAYDTPLRTIESKRQMLRLMAFASGIRPIHQLTGFMIQSKILPVSRGSEERPKFDYFLTRVWGG